MDLLTEQYLLLHVSMSVKLINVYIVFPLNPISITVNQKYLVMVKRESQENNSFLNN